MDSETCFLTLPDRRLAYQQCRGAVDKNSKKAPGILFLGGFASDMTGSKAKFLNQECRTANRGYLRFDYRGHGQSSGRFEDGTIGDWFDDALTVFDRLTEGPQLVIGSSMGGWIGLLLARARPERVAGFIGIAAAPDFTEELIVPTLTPVQREQLESEGAIYDDEAPPDRRAPMTKKLIDEARGRLVLREPLVLRGPAHLLQGQMDRDVPWQHALKIAERLTAPSVRVTLIKDGDHSLSRPEDLSLLWQVIQGFF